MKLECKWLFKFFFTQSRRLLFLHQVKYECQGCWRKKVAQNWKQADLSYSGPFYAFQSLWGILGLFWPFWAIYGHVVPFCFCWLLFGLFGCYWAFLGLLGAACDGPTKGLSLWEMIHLAFVGDFGIMQIFVSFIQSCQNVWTMVVGLHDGAQAYF